MPPGGQAPAFGQPAPVQAQTPDLKGFDPAIVELGMKYYRPPVSDCEPCHGFAGGGALALDTYFGRGTAPGPSLIPSKIDRAAMIEMVACGSLGTETLPMPAYLPAAWTKEHPCKGKVAADIPFEQKPPLAEHPMNMSQIEAVVTFVQAFYQCSGMDFPKCQMYWGVRSPACEIFK